MAFFLIKEVWFISFANSYSVTCRGNGEKTTSNACSSMVKCECMNGSVNLVVWLLLQLYPYFLEIFCPVLILSPSLKGLDVEDVLYQFRYPHCPVEVFTLFRVCVAYEWDTCEC